ncbi:MAG TPA: dynamin family protein [Methylophilaceae bacterium]|nr:dynamin family protein [Methylophilaceae bacterium]
MGNALEQQIAELQQWREQLAQTIIDYRDWLHSASFSDAMQELRLYDMEQALRNDRLILAFVAEFSRGKTETINALFFSDFNQRLLPCDPGRTTMCPTEIFWNEQEEPYIKLLPIETRKRDDGLAYLKSNLSAWSKLRLDIHSTDNMKQTLQALVQQKEVSLDEARSLGLWDDNDASMVQALQEKGKVDIPVWRHALINFPHPLLKSGLVILDTPGLNTLGTEPELTLNIIPNAHAVIFLLATDSGVTKSDMHIWSNYIRSRASRKLAVLNKIDILWDDMKSAAEIDAMIQKQVEATARQLNLASSQVFAISAQKALLARIRKDARLFQRSGMDKIEQELAEGVIAAKHDILRNTVVSETSGLVKVSRKLIQQRLAAARAQMDELHGLRGESRGVIENLLHQVTRDRKLYEASVHTFNRGNDQISRLGEILLHQLSLQHLDILLSQSKAEIGESWTTRGLNQGMKKLIKQTSELAEQLSRQGHEIKRLADELFRLFHSQHGFEQLSPAALDMSAFTQSMQALEKTTEAFCADPRNVMTEKHFLVKKFFLSLGREAQAIFSQAYQQSQQWLQEALAPLKLQMSEHKAALDKRTDALMQIHLNLDSLQKNIDQAEAQLALLHGHSTALDQILLKLVKAVKPAGTKAASKENAAVRA